MRSAQDTVADPIDNRLRQIGIDGQAKHVIGDPAGYRCGGRIEAGAAFVTVKRVGKRVEVFPGDNPFCRKPGEGRSPSPGHGVLNSYLPAM